MYWCLIECLGVYHCAILIYLYLVRIDAKLNTQEVFKSVTQTIEFTV